MSSSLARGGLNFIGAAVTQVGTMVVLLLITRNLSKTDVGLFRQSRALLAAAGRRAARAGPGAHPVRGRVPGRSRSWRVVGTVRSGMAIASASAIAVGVILYALSDWIATGIYDNPELVTPLRYVAFAGATGRDHDGGAGRLLGLRTMRPNAFLGLMLDPALRVVLRGSPSGRAPA